MLQADENVALAYMARKNIFIIINKRVFTIDKKG